METLLLAITIISSISMGFLLKDYPRHAGYSLYFFTALGIISGIWYVTAMRSEREIVNQYTVEIIELKEKDGVVYIFVQDNKAVNLTENFKRLDHEIDLSRYSVKITEYSPWSRGCHLSSQSKFRYDLVPRVGIKIIGDDEVRVL